jgi:hypothetical protein
MAKVVKERQMIFTTEAINSMTDKLNDGVILKRYENPWLKSEIGIRRSYLSKCRLMNKPNMLGVRSIYITLLKNIVILREKMVRLVK